MHINKLKSINSSVLLCAVQILVCFHLSNVNSAVVERTSTGTGNPFKFPLALPGLPLIVVLKGVEGDPSKWALVVSREDGDLGQPCSKESFVTPRQKLGQGFQIELPGKDTVSFQGFARLFICVNRDVDDTDNWIHVGPESTIHVCNKSQDNLCGPHDSLYNRFRRSANLRLEKVPITLRDTNSSNTPAETFRSITDKSVINSSDEQLRTNQSDKELAYVKSGEVVASEVSLEDDLTPAVTISFNDDNSDSSNSSELIVVTPSTLFLRSSPSSSFASPVSTSQPSPSASFSSFPNRRGRDVESSLPSSARSVNNVVRNGTEEGGKPPTSANSVRVFGMRLGGESRYASYDNGSIAMQAGTEVAIRLFGIGLDDRIRIQFTAVEDQFGQKCDKSTSDVFPLEKAHGNKALLRVVLPAMSPSQRLWYLCVRVGEEGDTFHQGSEQWLTISTYTLLLPIWIQVIMLVVLLILSGLFSGLNLGLMALDKTELKIVMNTGTPLERQYAKSIEPVRRHGNFLLCTLLLGNVLVNSTLTILLDTLSSGLIAVIGSTIGIVIFGEIVPQAICSRHGLSVGARTVWLVRIFMVITGAVSWPISKILDLLLGEEIGNTYDRDRLKELIRVTQDRNNLPLEEQNIIYGALELHQKTAAQVMTKLDDIFMLSVDCNLDFNTIHEIMQQGYSRIPIYENERTNIISVLLIKDLAFIDPDDNTPLRTVTQFYQNVCSFFFEDTTLDVIFKEFKHGNKGHMGFVQRVNNEGDCDPFYEVVGLITLEDVIEELIQEEIVDETDVFTDNRSKRRRKKIRRDFKEFSQQIHNSTQKKIQISPQLQLAALQFLRTSIDPFKEGQLSEGILKRMLNQDIVYTLKCNQEQSIGQQKHEFIYSQGKPADFFVLILEGHVEIVIGKENLSFESGPFSYFGLPALTLAAPGESPSPSIQASRGSVAEGLPSMESSKWSFTPDYSVKVISQVTFLKVRRSHYVAARRAFLVERTQKDLMPEVNFDLEVQKILHDESRASPPWDVESSGDTAAKEALLNGGSSLQRWDASTDSEPTRDSDKDRKFSLKELLPLKSLAPSSPNKRLSRGHRSSSEIKETDQSVGLSSSGAVDDIEMVKSSVRASVPE